MKKTRFLVLALAVAVMLMGAGYAWWNEKVEIKSEVTTGNLDVDIENIDVSSDTGITVDKNFGNEGSDTWAKLKFNKLYPGAGGTAVVTFRNNSTMSVKLDKKVEFHPDFTDENYEPFFGSWPFDNEHVAITVSTSLGNFNLVPGTEKFTYEPATPIEIPKDTTVTFTVKTIMDGPSNGNDTQNCDQMGFTLKPNFIQFNQQ